MKTKNIYYPELKSPIIRTNKLYPDQIHHYDLNQEVSWVKELLQEHSPALDEVLASQQNEAPKISCKFSIKRTDHETLEDPIAVEGTLQSTFWSECARCLTPVAQEIEVDINAVFIPSEKENHPEIEDQDCFYNDGQEYDIYFFEGQDINIKDLFNEIIQINLDPFALHDEECKGLCQSCGVDLNHEKCECKIK